MSELSERRGEPKGFSERCHFMYVHSDGAWEGERLQWNKIKHHE